MEDVRVPFANVLLGEGESPRAAPRHSHTRAHTIAHAHTLACARTCGARTLRLRLRLRFVELSVLALTIRTQPPPPPKAGSPPPDVLRLQGTVVAPKPKHAQARTGTHRTKRAPADEAGGVTTTCAASTAMPMLLTPCSIYFPSPLTNRPLSPLLPLYCLPFR